MGHNSVVSGHLKSTGIPRVDGLSTGPLDFGRHISTEERNSFRFQEGLSEFLKDKLSFHMLETYSEVIESALIAERSAKELKRYRE